MILVVMEHAQGKLSKSAYELVSAARQMGSEGPVTALTLGHGIADVAAEAARLTEQVLVADLPELAEYDAELWAAAVSQIAREGDATAVLIAGGRSGREFSPRVAIRLDAPLLEDVVTLRRDGETVSASRYSYLARVTETLEATGAVAVATVQPGAFPVAEANATSAEQFDVDLALPVRRLRVTNRTIERSNRVSLAEADVVVSGGRGVESAEGFTALVEGMAVPLGAAVGATRAIVDAGWRPYAEQVGQTGKTVQPRLYVAIGISGAVQHLSGMNKSKVIVAINKDADAPIFKIADYGVVGNVQEIVPAVIAELKKS